MAAEEKAFLEKFFEPLERLEKGTFATVYKRRVKAEHKYEEDNDVVAVKVYRHELSEMIHANPAVREVFCLKQLLGQPGIVKIYDHHLFRSTDDSCCSYIVLECMDMDLFSCITRNIKYQKRRVLKQIIEGLVSCHRANIIHRDIKAENILLKAQTPEGVGDRHGRAKSFEAKLCDFNTALSRNLNSDPYLSSGTFGSRSPESILGGVEHNSPACDMWSLGCLVAVILCRARLFQFPSLVEKKGTDEITDMEMKCILSKLGAPSLESWPEFQQLANYKKVYHTKYPVLTETDLLTRLDSMIPKKPSNPARRAQWIDLLMKMLKFNPKERITAEEALAHPLFG